MGRAGQPQCHVIALETKKYILNSPEIG